MARVVNGQHMNWDGYQFGLLFRDGTVLRAANEKEAQFAKEHFDASDYGPVTIVFRGSYVEDWAPVNES